MPKFVCINESDVNDSFTVEAPNLEAATGMALQELGWVMGSEPVDEEEKDEP